MPNVAEVIRDHVTLAVECVDRLYLNAYVPGLQRGPGVVAFLRQRGPVIASPVLFGEITDRFKSALQQYCSTRNLPWIEFAKGQDKDKLVEGGRRIHFIFDWRTVYVNHYYIYLIDREWDRRSSRCVATLR